MKPSRYYPGPAYFLISVLFIFFCSCCAFCWESFRRPHFRCASPVGAGAHQRRRFSPRRGGCSELGAFDGNRCYFQSCYKQKICTCWSNCSFSSARLCRAERAPWAGKSRDGKSENIWLNLVSTTSVTRKDVSISLWSSTLLCICISKGQIKQIMLLLWYFCSQWKCSSFTS